MKKILLFAFCFITTLMASAQETFSTAIDLKMGENTYVFEKAGYQTVYYKYTATFDQLLTLSYSYRESVSVRPDTTSYTTLKSQDSYNSVDSVYTSIYPLKKDTTVYVLVKLYDDAKASVTASREEADLSGGDTCDDPKFMDDGYGKFIPAGSYDMSLYEYKPTYTQYTPTEDGVLQMEFTNRVSALEVMEGCNGTLTRLEAEEDPIKGNYVAKHSVVANKTYIVAVHNAYPLIATFKLTQPTEGSSCDMPILVSTDTLNVLPKAAGEYWYQIVSPKQGYAVVSSDASLAGGTIRAFDSCTSSSAAAQTDGYLLLRSTLATDSTLLLCIEKAEATAEDQTFSVKIEGEQPGDTFFNPIVIGEGETTTPIYNGTYCYSITTPAGVAKRLTIAATDTTAIQSAATAVALFSEPDAYSAVGYGNKSFSAKVQADKTYYIVWMQSENKNNIKFSVTLTDLEQGDLYANPIPAVLGVNALANSDEKYYSYTPSQSCKLIVDTDPQVTVTFPEGSDSWSGDYQSKTDGTKTILEATAGKQYIMKFTGMTEATTFTLSEESFGEGEVKEKAIAMTADSIAVPEQVVDLWYSYIAPHSGVLTVKSDIDYEEFYDPTYHYSDVKVQIGNGYPSSICQYEYSSDYSSSKHWFEGKFTVNAGDTAYIHITTLTAQVGRSLTCTVVEAAPGETSNKPIALAEGDNTLKEATRTAPVWYSVDLNSGDSLYVSFPGYVDATLYAANNLSDYLCFSSYIYKEGEGTSYYLAYKNTTEAAATYLIKVESASEGTVANVQIVKDPTGISDIKANATRINAVYDMQGRKVSVDGGRLTKGLYIINGKKVIVK